MAQSQAFDGRLLPGEHLLWTGRPKAGVIFTAKDVFLIPFSIFWCVSAVFWFGMALSAAVAAHDQGQTNVPLIFPVFGIPFIAMGLFATVGRFPLDAWLRAKTTYGPTETRALIARAGPWPKFTAIQLSRAPECEIREGKDGRATIFFGARSGLFDTRSMGFGYWLPSLDPTPRFLSIPDGRKVFGRIQLAITQPRSVG